jgi:hypothetical protein
VDPDSFRGQGFQTGYDPVWVDLLAKHAEKPFHLLIGGGDQLYCDACVILRGLYLSQWGQNYVFVFQSRPGTRTTGMAKSPKTRQENELSPNKRSAVRDRQLLFQSLLPDIS